MTGELSLIGKVLPVGGIKEKILAAKRAGITTLILPRQNEKDVADVPSYALTDMTIHYADHVEQIFDLILLPALQKKTVTKKKAAQSRLKGSASVLRSKSVSQRAQRN
jgi:ATP-dependent Lon protease